MRHRICEICGRDMVAGQTRRHGVCDPAHPAYRPTTGFDRGMTASQAAADSKWSPVQIALVDKAIADTARMTPAFTADDVWIRLGDDFPVTKGMAARLTAAVRRGLIENTGETRFSNRGGAHCHNQRLTLWRSLTGGQTPMAIELRTRR